MRWLRWFLFHMAYEGPHHMGLHAECHCVTGADLGMYEYAGCIAYAHWQCPDHWRDAS